MAKSFKVDCPHKLCDGVIPVHIKDESGVYWCKCHGIQVRLRWVDGKPQLSQV
jgi:hypothetical protein